MILNFMFVKTETAATGFAAISTFQTGKTAKKIVKSPNESTYKIYLRGIFAKKHIKRKIGI